MGIAIITGASSGMGRAFARRIDESDDADGFWLIARRADRLQELAASLSKPARVIPVDLTDEGGLSEIEALLSEERPEISHLINAAGFGKIGDWEHVSSADQSNMIDLNCRACVALTNLALPYMKRGSHLLEIVSSASFTPLPHLNVYAASKAFMLSYTRALRWEVRSRGICATAVCPCWVKTEFIEVAQRTEGARDIRRFPFAQRPETVARRALAANKLHFAVATCGIIAFLMRIACKFIPHCAVMLSWEGLRRV